MGIIEVIWGILEKPTSIGGGLFIEIMLFIMPIWFAFVVGLLIGWIWKPMWWNKKKIVDVMAKIGDFPAPPSNYNLGFSSISQSLNVLNMMNFLSCKVDEDDKGSNGVTYSFGETVCSSPEHKGSDHPAVNDDDLIHLRKIAEEKDGGPSWIQMMDRSTSTMSYRAWQRDPENGPPQYRSSTIFEDATPEMVRDFFWDDDFRPKWDNMLSHHKILEECPNTGLMIVHWIRKFPFFCSDREYIIGRRIWEAEKTFYCVTKGVPSSMPRKDKPRRVDLFYSSWCIRPVESKRGSGETTACEVLLFHHEDMGIPWELLKFGVRRGMWGAVKKMDPGLRAYQKARASGGPLSPSASMAQITTKVDLQHLNLISNGDDQSTTEVAPPKDEKHKSANVPKLLIFSAAVALACSLDQGLLTKAIIFGVARRLGRT